MSLLLLSGLARCDGAYGCTACDSPATYPSPAPPGGELLPDAIAGQVQERAVLFFAEHLSDVLRANLQTRVVGGVERAIVYLPEGSFAGGTVLLRDGCIGAAAPAACPPALRTFASKIEIPLPGVDDVVDARFLFSGGPDRVRITLTDIDLFLDLGLVLDLGGGGDAACRVRDEALLVPAVHLDSLAFDLIPSIDANGLFWLDAANVEVLIDTFDDLSLAEMTISACNQPSGACDDPSCHDGWLDLECGTYCGVGNLIFSGAEFFQSLLAPLIESFAPGLVESMLDGLFDAANGRPLAGVARWPGPAALLGGGSALVPYGSELGAGALTSADSFRVSGPPGGRGMSLVLDAGSFAEASLCPPTVSLPSFAAAVGPLPVFDGVIDMPDPSTGLTRAEAYHLVLFASEAWARQLGYSFYRAGGLCLTVAPEEIDRLSGGAFVPTLAGLALIAPALADLGEPTDPIGFVLHPTAVPRISFAAEPPLIRLELGEVGVSAYALLDDAAERLATVAADVVVLLDVERTAANTLRIALAELEVTDVVEVYDESSGPTDFGAIAEVLIELAVERLLESFGELDVDVAPLVSSMLGGAPVYARINDVRRVGQDGASYLTAFLTFCDEADLANPDRPPCYTPPPPPPPASTAEIVAREAGAALLSVPPGDDYAARVDGGLWRSYRGAPSGRLRVDSALLRLPGQHIIELRSRPRGAFWLEPRAERVTLETP